MRHVCRHGVPITIEITPADWMPDHTLRHTVKMTTCKTCDEEGMTLAILKLIEGALARVHGQ